MTSLDFTKYLKTKGLTNIYPNNIPKTLPSEGFAIGVYNYSSNMDKYIATGRIKYQFITVMEDLNQCEAKANEVMLLLNDLIINETINNLKVQKLHLLQIAPIYIGVDESNRYKFSFNIELDVHLT